MNIHFERIQTLRKRKVNKVIILLLSAIIIVSAGVIIANSNKGGSPNSQIVINGTDVDFTARGWFQREGDSTRTRLVNSNSNDDKYTISISASNGPETSSLEVDNSPDNNCVSLLFDKRYVLFTYEFTNTAIDMECAIEISLSISSPENNNLKAIKYSTDASLYTENELNNFVDTVSSERGFNNDIIMADGEAKYYYILLEIDDLSLPISFFPCFTWTLRGMSVGSK